MKINRLKSVDDITFNLEEFGKTNNVLLVTGLSGSGKSYLTKKLVKKYNAELIQLDWLKHQKYASKFGKVLLNKFKKKYPESIPYIDSKWNNEPDELKNDLYKKYLNLFFDFIIEHLDSKKLYIIEGLQIFCMIDYNKTLDYPIIIKGTSSMKSLLYRYKRDYDDEEKVNLKTKIRFHIRVLKASKTFQFYMRKLLNKYIKSNIVTDKK